MYLGQTPSPISNITFPIGITQGGHGGTTQTSGRAGLGILSTGDALLTAANQSAARSAILAAKSGVNDDLISIPVNTTINGFKIGYREVGRNVQNAGYTTVMNDSGLFIYMNSVGTFTIPSNSVVAYPIGTAITFLNMTGSNCSIANGDNMYQAFVGSSGTRTLANFGIATALKYSEIGWIISGSGLS